MAHTSRIALTPALKAKTNENHMNMHFTSNSVQINPSLLNVFFVKWSEEHPLSLGPAGATSSLLSNAQRSVIAFPQRLQ